MTISREDRYSAEIPPALCRNRLFPTHVRPIIHNPPSFSSVIPSPFSLITTFVSQYQRFTSILFCTAGGQTRKPGAHRALSSCRAPASRLHKELFKMAAYELRAGDVKNKKQSVADLKYRRLQELNSRLKEDLDRPRVRISEASISSVHHRATLWPSIASSASSCLPPPWPIGGECILLTSPLKWD